MRRSLVATAALALPLLLAAGPLSAQTGPAKPADRWTIIHAGTLLVSANEPVQKNVSVVVRNDKIESIRPGAVAPQAIAGATPGSVKVVELGDKFVMAGLIDAHTHNGSGSFPETFKKLRDRVLNGTTVVRDAGSTPEIIFQARDAILGGYAVGPRVLAAGAGISATAGHGDHRNGRIEVSPEEPPYSGGICDGEDQCMHAARMQILQGANVVKIMATSGVLDNSDTGLEQQFTDAELHGLVTAAHLMKRKVMAHAIGQEGIKAAVKAGVDSVDHGNYLDDEGAQLMKARGTYLVPTLAVIYNSYLRATNQAPGQPPLSENSRHKILSMPDSDPKVIGRHVRTAVRNGVKIAVGTDTCCDVKDELVDLVKMGGMTSRQVLAAATLGGSDLLGIADSEGSIAAGKSADIVAFDGDPLADIEAVRKLNFVMARGSVVKAGGVPVPSL